MKQRIITGLILIAVCVPALVFGGWPLRILLFTAAGIASYEMLDIRKSKMNWFLFAFLFLSIVFLYNVPNQAYFTALCIFLIVLYSIGIWSKEINVDDVHFVIVMALLLTMAIKGIIITYDYNVALLLFVVLEVYATDGFALLTGMQFGKHKLNPRVSPHKTVEGFIGGYLCGMALAYVFQLFFPIGLSQPIMILLLATIPLVSQTGDLAFSLIKRHYQVKDFGTIFPGHGGVLDRIDSLLFAMVFVNAILLLWVL